MSGPALYRKKPVVIEAVQVDSHDYDGMCEIAAWCGGRADETDGHVIAIDTLEGTMFADPGDWIIRGTEGEFYPCKPAAFAGTFDPDEEADPVEAVAAPGYPMVDYHRELALRMAIRSRGGGSTPAETLDAAGAFYEFLTRQTEATP